jgi:hypothetical protein
LCDKDKCLECITPDKMEVSSDDAKICKCKDANEKLVGDTNTCVVVATVKERQVWVNGKVYDCPENCKECIPCVDDCKCPYPVQCKTCDDTFEMKDNDCGCTCKGNKGIQTVGDVKKCVDCHDSCLGGCKEDKPKHCLGGCAVDGKAKEVKPDSNGLNYQCRCIDDEKHEDENGVCSKFDRNDCKSGTYRKVGENECAGICPWYFESCEVDTSDANKVKGIECALRDGIVSRTDSTNDNNVVCECEAPKYIMNTQAQPENSYCQKVDIIDRNCETYILANTSFCEKCKEPFV